MCREWRDTLDAQARRAEVYAWPRAPRGAAPAPPPGAAPPPARVAGGLDGIRAWAHAWPRGPGRPLHRIAPNVEVADLNGLPPDADAGGGADARGGRGRGRGGGRGGRGGGGGGGDERPFEGRLGALLDDLAALPRCVRIT